MILDRFRLDGQVAVVTGAGRGIGAGTALALAEAGADVARSPPAPRRSSRRSPSRSRRSAGGRSSCRRTSRTSTRWPRWRTRAADELGRLDLVVNNVGGTIPNAFLDTTPDYLEEAFRFNVSTAHALSRAAVPLMLARRRRADTASAGSIVNISSVMGRLAGRGYLAYGTAKAALAHWTRLAARDLDPHIRVNGIAVGSVMTSALEFVAGAPAPRRRMEAVDAAAADRRGRGHRRDRGVPGQPGRRLRHRQDASRSTAG